MTYIGNPHGTGFSIVTSQQFSGTGSATAFTMRHAVGQPEHVEVYVNNVRQDPHSAYTVSGTTLTFTEAPSNATNNIYVVYIGGALNTADIPPDTNLSLKQGIKSAPSLFKNDTIGTGLYFPEANAIGLVQGDKEMLKANNSIIELKISGSTVATINSTGMNISGTYFDDGSALISSITANTQLGSGVVTQHAIASGNVVTSTINAGAVTAAKIAAGNVVTAAINDGAITAAKISDGVISAAKMTTAFINANTDFASALVDASNIKADAINPQHIADGAINANTMIAANIIDASNIKAGAVGGSELASGAVSANTKIAVGVVTPHAIPNTSVHGRHANTDFISAQTELAAAPADTDEFLVSDAGVLKRIDYSHLKGVDPSSVTFMATGNTSQQTISSSSFTRVQMSVEQYDTASAFAGNVFTVPSGKGGFYLFSAGLNWLAGSWTGQSILRILSTRSGSTVKDFRHFFFKGGTENGSTTTCIMELQAGDIVEVQGYQATGSSQNTYESAGANYFLGTFLGTG